MVTNNQQKLMISMFYFVGKVLASLSSSFDKGEML